MRTALLLALATALQNAPQPHPGYERRTPHDPNGIGKFYMGREIAHVMGHPAAAWLERPEREQEEAPSKAVEALDLKAGMVVADVGVGTGYYAFRIAPKLGDTGRVLGVDIQPEMLAKLQAKAEALGVRNVVGVLGTEQDPKLPKEGVDLVLMVDVYHEFEFPYEMMTAIRASLKPGGRVAFIEYRKEDPKVPIKEVHKMSEAQIRKEMEVVGLAWVKTVDTLPWQHLVVFRR